MLLLQPRCHVQAEICLQPADRKYGLAPYMTLETSVNVATFLKAVLLILSIDEFRPEGVLCQSSGVIMAGE